MAEKLYSYDFTPALSPGDGATSENGRVKQSELIADFDDISYAIFSARIKGTWCSDRGSVAATCNIWVKSKSGNQTCFEVGDKVTIYYSTNYVWTTTIANDGGNNYISFGDGQCETPAVPAIADYSAAAFIDALTIKVEPTTSLIPKDSIIVVGDGALTGDDVARSAADTTKISTKVSTLETQTDSVIETAGGLKSDVVKATNVVKQGTDSIFEDDNPDNMVLDGTAEVFSQGDGLAFGFEATTVAATSYSEETTVVKHGSSSQKFTTSATGVGIKALIDPEVGGITTPGASQKIGKNLAGKECTIVAWVRSDVANNISIGFWDDQAGYDTTAQTISADTWTLVSATVTIDASATEVYGIVRSATASAASNYVDFVAIYLGGTAFEVAPSTQSRVIHNQLEVQPYMNLIPFGDFAAQEDLTNDFESASWLGGTSVPPTGWQTAGLNTIVRDTTEYKFANACVEATLVAGGSMYHYIGMNDDYTAPMTNLVGRWATFSAWIKADGVANTEDVTLEISQDIGAGYVSVATADFTVDDYTDWTQVCVTGYISTSADKVRVRFINNGGASLDVFIDGVMCHPGTTPVAFTPNSGWKQCSYQMYLNGNVPTSPTEMSIGYGVNARVLLDTAHILYGGAAYEAIRTADTDTFYPREYKWNAGGAAFGTTDLTNITVSLAGASEEYDTDGVGSTNEPYLVGAGRMLSAVCDSNGMTAGGADATFTIFCLTWRA